MKIRSIFKLVFHNINLNKIRFILNTIITFLLSLTFIFVLYLGISLSYNFKRVYEVYIDNNEVTISLYSRNLSDNFHSIIDKSSNKFDYTYSTFNDTLFYDFQNIKYADFNLTSGELPCSNTNQILLSDSYITDYTIDKEINLFGKNYIIKGFYDSKEFNCPIMDLTYNISLYDINHLKFIYNHHNDESIKNDIKKINNFIKDIKKWIKLN